MYSRGDEREEKEYKEQEEDGPLLDGQDTDDLGTPRPSGNYAGTPRPVGVGSEPISMHVPRSSFKVYSHCHILCQLMIHLFVNISGLTSCIGFLNSEVIVVISSLLFLRLFPEPWGGTEEHERGRNIQIAWMFLVSVGKPKQSSWKLCFWNCEMAPLI